MHLEAFAAPPFDENAYLVGSDSGEAVIVDPGDGTPALIERARSLDLHVRGILLTHAHLDHISSVDVAKRAYNVPILLHPADRFLYDAIVEQGRYFGFEMRQQPPVDSDLGEGMTLEVGDLRLTVRETPGHSPGSVVLEVVPPSGGGVVLSGDTLFAGSIGRTDLPGGDLDTLIASIRTVLLPMADGVRVYPGHYGATTIGAERRSNPFLA
jgi:glyoxylase-like metal-dependent hydrolase (beta-lactamase superfamily II)